MKLKNPFRKTSHLRVSEPKDWVSFGIWLTVALSVFLRIVIFLQQRDLFVDEANVARNLWEKSYSGLAGILDYEQFAPPIFLWLSKLSSSILGFNEISLRLFPLLFGIVAVFLFLKVAAYFFPRPYVLYPLVLIASAFILLRYGTELKQYMGDFLITLTLIYYALKTSSKQPNFKFVAFWCLLGTCAIWFSMPSVFILFGIGLYWLVQIIRNQNVIKNIGYLITLFFWLIQFGFYYFYMLQDQISSDYLQNFHADTFLSISDPINSLDLMNIINKSIIGPTHFNVFFGDLILLCALIEIFRNFKTKHILLIAPYIALFIASFLHLYAMVPRLLLFIQPLTFLLLGIGVYSILKIRITWIRYALYAGILVNVFNQNNFKYFFEKLEVQEVRVLMNQVTADEAKGTLPLFIFHGSIPAFTFYTEMHDDRAQYQILKNNSCSMTWKTGLKHCLDSVGPVPHFTIIMSSYYPSELEAIKAQIPDYRLVDQKIATGSILLRYKAK